MGRASHITIFPYQKYSQAPPRLTRNNGLDRRLLPMPSHRRAGLHIRRRRPQRRIPAPNPPLLRQLPQALHLRRSNRRSRHPLLPPLPAPLRLLLPPLAHRPLPLRRHYGGACDKFKATIAFLFLASIFFLASAILGWWVSRKGRRTARVDAAHSSHGRRKWYRRY